MDNSKQKFFTFPTHDLPEEAHQVSIHKLSHTNPYDFTKKHRHKYFELLFFEKGGGSQLIDFEEYTIEDNSCYIVLPNQIHLLKRHAKSNGLVVQFYAQVILSNTLMSLFPLLGWSKMSGKLFGNDPDKYLKHKSIFELLVSKEDRSSFDVERNRHLLLASLYALLGDQSIKPARDANRSEMQRFSSLLEQNFAKEHLVKFYSSNLGLSDKNLSLLTNKHLGLTPLKVIHGRILLEAKRILLFDEHSHKEIAFHLGFDSPSSFTNFIKSKTGLTPSKLQSELVGIHN